METVITAIAMMLVLGAILGLGLGIADKFLSVEVDERIEKVSSMLPNYNCGSCGYAGCSGLAEALVNGEISVVGTCKPCKPDQKAAIAEYLNNTPGPDGVCVKVKP
ncbi:MULTISPECIES: (Fe-S)-binding protein [Bacillota]|jgi:Na+-translocating ferredoxin:NAD+ oxidoreductase subunit B|uniref:Electron transporter RnfB n=2 Tax=Amedibacillus TaxID=2749846 RepID=A0A7G9GL19_9FIRM|nr:MULTISPECIES: (Fe-S)-binding protein [Bacillota]QNM11501.1 electron transporter RnfB [[Eubacterium] hominis]MCH4284483.1 electron transporter RnfB [Amedibacillus hominis]RGB54655.1 electron transporter RnfB [Absiella sp. AM22-9]RGB56289.1 electron transporter RnfB [Absiella sp. AM10-20]RGB65787.1 electron transporter RnfB [Absiella sp. AM09-45]